ncbi:MAG: hypothetical protein ABI831_16085 [Betaproteobacteria bacterium]
MRLAAILPKFAATLFLAGLSLSAFACPALLDHTFATLTTDRPVNLCQYEGNFHKYLIDRAGRVRSFDSAVEPESCDLLRAIDGVLVATVPLAGTRPVG